MQTQVLSDFFFSFHKGTTFSVFCLIMNKLSSAEFAACAVATTQQRGDYRNTQSYFLQSDRRDWNLLALQQGEELSCTENVQKMVTFFKLHVAPKAEIKVMTAVLQVLQDVHHSGPFEAEVPLKTLSFSFVFQKQLDVNVLHPLLLSDGVVLEDQAGGPHHTVALPQVSPPHVLISDLDDVADREPALLAI